MSTLANRLWLLTLLACGSTQEPDAQHSESTQGGTQSTSDDADEESGTTIYLVSAEDNQVVGSMTLTPEEVAELNRRRRERGEQEDTERAQQREEYASLCGYVTVVHHSVPPIPPTTPNHANLQALESVYQSALDPPPAPPATMDEYSDWSRTTFVNWINSVHGQLVALEQATPALARDQDRVVGAAWVAHAYAVLVHNIVGIPAPQEVQNDAELLAIVQRAFTDPIYPVIDKAKAALDRAPEPRDANWRTYVQEVREWLDGVRCEIHPGRP